MSSDVLGPARLLLLPGWLNSDGAHWQSRWEVLHGDERVEQDDWVWPKRGDWMARLDEVVLEAERPAVLVAHSLGCQLVAAWAAHSRNAMRVRAALLVAIPDTERVDMAPNLAGWRPVVRRRLPDTRGPAHPAVGGIHDHGQRRPHDTDGRSPPTARSLCLEI